MNDYFTPLGRVLAFGIGLFLLVAFIQPSQTVHAACDPNAVYTRVSVASDGTEGNDKALNPPVISGDGRFIAFSSAASNLVPNDTNNFADTFVYDRMTCQTERISVATDGTEANGDSWPVDISNDGNRVAFMAVSTNLVVGGQLYEVLLHNRQTGETVQIDSRYVQDAVFSQNGRYMVYKIGSSSLPTEALVYVIDLQTTILDPVFISADGQTRVTMTKSPRISNDGRYLVFSTNDSLLPNDTNHSLDVYLYDRQTQQFVLISVNLAGNAPDSAAEIFTRHPFSQDAHLVFFASMDKNLVAGDTNTVVDIFARDWQAGTTTRISLTSDGEQMSTGSDWFFDTAADGQYVTFPPFSGGQIYLEDLRAHHAVWLSQTWGVSSSAASLSQDGHLITFSSDSPDIVPGDTNNVADVFVASVDALYSSFTVNSADDVDDGVCDDVHCSLREAINTVNASLTENSIIFDILTAAPQIIQPVSPLPAISKSVVLDGTTQPGYSGTPLIALDGSLLTAGDGLVIQGGNSVVRGLSIQGFPGNGITIDSSSNTVGGLWPQIWNVISDNGGDGVSIENTSNHVKIRGNSIFDDAGLGIDLGGDGVTLNDLNDTDSGPNQLQNFPILLNAYYSSPSALRIIGQYQNKPTTGYYIDLYASETCNPSGYGEGKVFVTSIILSVFSASNTIFATSVASNVPAGWYITATAAGAAFDNYYATSEFSPCIAIAAEAPNDAPPRNYFTTAIVTLTWTPVDRAIRYGVQVDDDLYFGSPEYTNFSIPASAHSIDVGPLPEGTYYWHVIAKRPSGRWIGWSTPDSFVVDLP